MAASTYINFTSFLPKLKCLKCSGKLLFTDSNFICKKCGVKNYLPYSKRKIRANESIGEKIFDIPFLYNLKINFLNSLNRLRIPIDPYVKNREILDIGCGSYQVRYNPGLAKLRVGIDPSVKALTKAQQLYPESMHLIGSADRLPFVNKSFDVTLLLFTLHHLNSKQWADCLKEATRVTKKTIIIYDHIKNDSKILSGIQLLYWNTFDGGLTYPTAPEWKERLKGFKIKKYLRLGNMFKHICFYEIDLKK